MNNVISAVCIKCGAEYEAHPNLTTCKACGGILDIKYDYAHIKASVSPDEMKDRRDYSMWRYREFLPIEGNSKVPKLRVGWSPFTKPTDLQRLLE